MIDAELLNLLRCPETRQALTLIEPAALAALNSRVAAGTLQNRSGKPISEPLQNALVRADGAVAYPVRQNIPIMLVEEAVPLS